MYRTTVFNLVAVTVAVAFACACGGNSMTSPSSTSPPSSNPSLTVASAEQNQVAAIISEAFIAALQQSLPAVFPADPSSRSGVLAHTHLLPEVESLAQAAQTGSAQIGFGLTSLPTTPITQWTITLAGTGVQFPEFGCTFGIGGNVVVTYTPGSGGLISATENLQTTILNCPSGSQFGPPYPTYPVTYFQSWGIPVNGLQVSCSLALTGNGVLQPEQECSVSGTITFYDPNPCASSSAGMQSNPPLCSDFETVTVGYTYSYSDFPTQPPSVSGQMGTTMSGTLPSVEAPTASFTQPPSPLSVSLSPPMDVQSCVPGSSSGESIDLETVQPDSNGNINSVWYVQNGAQTPIMQVTGSLTASTFSVNLTCSNGGGSGSISATGNNYNYDGTYTLNTP